MRYCPVEREDFPDDEFRIEDGKLMHAPPDGEPHRVSAWGSDPPDAGPPPSPCAA